MRSCAPVSRLRDSTTTRGSRIAKDAGAGYGPRPLRLFHFSGARGSIVPALYPGRHFYFGIEFMWVMERTTRAVKQAKIPLNAKGLPVPNGSDPAVIPGSHREHQMLALAMML